MLFEQSVNLLKNALKRLDLILKFETDCNDDIHWYYGMTAVEIIQNRIVDIKIIHGVKRYN